MEGVYPILSMPFTNSRQVDVESLEREVEYLIEAGVDGLGLGLATEIPKLSEAERDLALQTVVRQARGRVKIVMKSDALGTDLAIHYSRRAAELGADALMVMPAPASSGAETKAYFHEIARAAGRPIFIQDVPTAPVGPALAAQIAREAASSPEGVELAHPWYLKAESPPTAPRVAEAVAAGGDSLVVFGGAHGAFFVEELRRGSVGTMPGAVVPEAYVETWRLWREGKEKEAAAHFARYGTLLRLFAQMTGIGTYLVKETLRRQGIFTTSVVRPPSAEPDQLSYRELADQLELLGVKVRS